MRATIPKLALVFAFAARGLVEGQVVDLAGKWRVGRPPVVGASSTPFEDWLRALPGAVFTLTPSVIPPQLRDFVLERGVRLDQAAPGSGLGLAIVRDLAELYGGLIALEDSRLSGLSARLSLPAA
jgi:hypothetical protein